MTGELRCADERRRTTVRAAGLNGVESISVSADQRTLTVLFFGNAPQGLEPDNFRIDGGRHVTGIVVESVHDCADQDPETADCVQLTVDGPGDHSTYRLCIVEKGPHGRPGVEPYPGFDPRYACRDFSFKQNCPDLVDCAPVEDCPPTTYAEPAIDYLAKDYASFRQFLLDRLSLTMPAWTEPHAADIGIALVEVLAYAGDELSYYQDAVATEAYLDTARLRVSVRRHVRLVDYAMHDGCASRAWVCVAAAQKVTLSARDFRFVTLGPAAVAHHGTAHLDTDLASFAAAADPSNPTGAGYQVFEPVHAEDVELYPAHTDIHLWTWGDRECCLTAGATTATFVDGDPGGEPVLRLRPGEVLIFEEVRDPKTGREADADPTHCQAVRLTSVRRSVDELYDQPLLEVAWDREDALTFPFCISSRGGPECEEIEVGVAHGNVVLVEHGRRLDWCGGQSQAIDVPEAPAQESGCPDPTEFGCADQSPAQRPGYPPLRPRLAASLDHSPVTQSAPYPAPADVARMQARRLLGLPDRSRDRLRRLWRTVHGGGQLTADDTAYLTVLFGAPRLAAVRFGEEPAHALRILLARFDDLLAAKLQRLADLVRRARSGYVLDPADEGWEIAQTWGAAEAEEIDASNPACRGPAQLALRPDPRAALPALTVALDGDPGPPWTPRRDLLDSGPTDRHLVGELDDEGVLSLRFGDDTAGAAPPPGGRLLVSYRVGNGPAGNVGRNAINGIVFCQTRQDAITGVRNPLPASGGTAPEPVAEVRLRAPAEPRQRLARAITADDYATLAGQIQGVQRAACQLRWTGSWYEAQVAVDPLGQEVAPRWLLDQVGQGLHPYRRIGQGLSVATATLVPLDVALHVETSQGYIPGHVREALLRVFGSGVLRDGRKGFFHPDNLTFGTPVRASQLVAAAVAVPGVRHVEVTCLQRMFGPPDDALDTGVLILRSLEVAQLDNDAARPDRGRLTLDVSGDPAPRPTQRGDLAIRQRRYR